MKKAIPRKKNDAWTSRLVKTIAASYREEPYHHLAADRMPSEPAIQKVTNQFKQILFPGYFGEPGLTPSNVHYFVGELLHEIRFALRQEIVKAWAATGKKRPSLKRADTLTCRLLERIPAIRNMLKMDVQAAMDGDPAAKSIPEVIISYPCLKVILVYRIAHELYLMHVPLIPRMMTEYAHSISGVDIHPGARIGHHFFIDHGTGVVVGETTVIGNHVKLYQGVTLGALSFPKDEKGKLIKGLKRHPTIRDHVTIYANATILGGKTVIGENAVIGGNEWIISSVEPGHKVATRTTART